MRTCTCGYIYRRCIILKNGQRICRPPGKAFRFPARCTCKHP